MNVMRLALQTLATAGLMCAGSASHATFTVYTSQADFLAAVVGSGTDTFTGFSVSSATPSPLTRSAGAFSYRATTSDLSPAGFRGFFGGGAANPFLSSAYALDTITFSDFSDGVQGIAGNFFGSNASAAYAAGSVTVTVTDASGSSTQTLTPTGASAGSFVGFVSDGPIESLVLSAVQPSPTSPLWPSVDDLRLARVAAVPEPGTVALTLGGLGIVGFMVRRRA